ncbi:metallophosphoesterase [Mycolicibacterium sp. Y3]
MDTYDNAIVAGDIHGQYEPLRSLLLLVRERSSALILLGDYVNRGLQSRVVLDILSTAPEREAGKFVFLRGNHERALLRFLDGGPLEDFAAHGGLATIKSYLGSDTPDDPVAVFRERFDPSHRDFLESLPSFLETENFLFSHTGFDPSDILLRTDAAVAGNGNPRIFTHTGPWPKRRTFFGHFVQTGGKPFVTSHLVCLDTGCGTFSDGPLTAYDIERDEILQFEAGAGVQ